jgi:hypothetical protein
MSDGEFSPRNGLVIPAGKRLIMPVGNTAQRPLVPQVGDYRYNTDFSTFEGFYANGQWAALASFGTPNSPVFGTSVTVGNSTVNTYLTPLFINMSGNAVYVNTTTIFLGNTTVNMTANSLGIQVGPNVVVNSTYVGVGNSTVNILVNSTAIGFGPNHLVTQTSDNFGNSTVYSNVTATFLQVVNTASNTVLLSTGLSINGGNTVVNATGLYISAGQPSQSVADYWQTFTTVSTNNVTLTTRSSTIANTATTLYFSLPATPANTDAVRVRRVGNNSVFLMRNGQTINGLAQDFEIDVNYAQIEVRFDGVGNTWNTFVAGLFSGIASSNNTLISALNYNVPVTLASAASVAIGAANSNIINLTGTASVTSFDTIAAGAEREITHQGVQVLTYNATSMLMPGAASITTANNDVSVWRSLGSGNWQMTSYQRYSGAALVGPSSYATSLGY